VSDGKLDSYVAVGSDDYDVIQSAYEDFLYGGHKGINVLELEEDCD